MEGSGRTVVVGRPRDGKRRDVRQGKIDEDEGTGREEA